jgi:hypothetical protein
VRVECAFFGRGGCVDRYLGGDNLLWCFFCDINPLDSILTFQFTRICSRADARFADITLDESISASSVRKTCNCLRQHAPPHNRTDNRLVYEEEFSFQSPPFLRARKDFFFSGYYRLKLHNILLLEWRVRMLMEGMKEDRRLRARRG